MAKLFRIRLSSNLLILVLNLNLLIIQYIYFNSWMTDIRNKEEEVIATDVDNRKQHASDDGDPDEVLVYNSKLNHEAAPEHRETKINNLSTWDWNWDGRADSGAKVHRYIYLVRHGQYYGNGPYEKHLSPIGKHQAAKTGEKLKSLNITFHRFVTSTAYRAAETAQIIQERLGVPRLDLEHSDELREGWPCYPDPDSPGAWDKNDPIFATDVPRLHTAFDKFIHRADVDWKENHNELIVVHGNVISYFFLRALQLAPERWLKLAVFQASLTMLQIDPNGDVAVRFVGDVGHLQKSEWTG